MFESELHTQLHGSPQSGEGLPSNGCVMCFVAGLSPFCIYICIQLSQHTSHFETTPQIPPRSKVSMDCFLDLWVVIKVCDAVSQQ